jgi:hypothetical protein
MRLKPISSGSAGLNMGVLPPPSNMFACRTEYKLQGIKGINGVLDMISSNIKQGRYTRKELKEYILSDLLEVEEDDTKRSSSEQGQQISTGGHSAWSRLFTGDAAGREAVRGGKSPSARNGRNLMPLSSPAPSP